jgi:4-oxalocrotonate tautomerase
MYEGRTKEQKNEIVDVFTKEMSRIIQRVPKHIHIEFNEMPVDENAPAELRERRKGE